MLQIVALFCKCNCEQLQMLKLFPLILKTITQISVIENTTSLHNGYSSRMGLIPIHSDNVATYNPDTINSP